MFSDGRAVEKAVGRSRHKQKTAAQSVVFLVLAEDRPGDELSHRQTEKIAHPSRKTTITCSPFEKLSKNYLGFLSFVSALIRLR